MERSRYFHYVNLENAWRPENVVLLEYSDFRMTRIQYVPKKDTASEEMGSIRGSERKLYLLVIISISQARSVIGYAKSLVSIN